jgi:phenylacetate-CoA ligase
MPKETFNRLKKVIIHAYQYEGASFYLNKYLVTTFNPSKVESVEDISSIPFLTREELQICPVWDRLYVSIDDVLSFGYTSGTTSKKVLPLFLNRRSQFTTDSPETIMKRGLVLWSQPFRSTLITYRLQRKKILTIQGDFKNLPFTAKLASIVNIDGIFSTPSLALMFAQDLKKCMDIAGIRELLLIGENISEVRKRVIQEAYPNASIRNMYGSNETGHVGTSCPAIEALNVFHQDSHFYFEVINPKTEDVVPDGEEGELVVTTLELIPTPLIRYRTGDAAAIVPTCGCDKNRPAFKILGRIGYDAIKIGGLELKADRFEKGVEKVSDLIASDQFEVHVYDTQQESSVVPQLAYKLFITRSLAPFEKEYLETTIKNNTKFNKNLSITTAEEKHYIAPTTFEYLTESEEERGQRMFRKRKVLIRH